MHSLRTKIGLMTMLVCLFAVIVVTATSIVFIRSSERQQSDQLLLLMCETGEKNIDYYFSSVEKAVRKMSAYTEKDLDGLDDEKLAAHAERISAYFEEIANKTNGVLTYYYRIDPTVNANVKGFWYTNLTGNDFIEHEVTDITQYDLDDTTKLVWFTVPRATGNAIWLPPYITENLDMKVISYNVPIFYRGRFIGVIGIEIDYSTLVEQVGALRLYNNGYAFLTDARGSLIYHPKIDLSRLSAEERPATPEGLLSESTFTRYTYNGVEKRAVWLSLSNGMRLYISVPQRETEGEWERLLRDTLIAAAIVILLVIVGARFFSGRITKPLKELTEAAKLADNGNYDFKLDYKGKDEVGTLTNTFTRMAGHMKEHISDLSKRVYVDALTSVRNKGAFAAYIEDMQGKMDETPENTEFAIGVFDCDDLKSVNDRFGHDKGDLYLKTASRLICKTFQHSPVFRIGGDEFAVVLRNDDYRNRADLIEKFESAMEESTASAANPWEQVHVAMGIAVFNPEEDHAVIDTVRRADKVMYTNKRKYKNTAEGFTRG